MIKALSLTVLFLMCFITEASTKISYSGRLTAANGSPIPGPVSINLQIVNSSSTILCSIIDGSVPLSNGVFHLEVDYGTTCDSSRTLKQIISDSVNSNEELFIKIVDQTNLKPYPAQAITSTPLAIFAHEAASVREDSITNTNLKGIASDCADGEILAGAGAGSFKCISAGSGSVTSITAGTGLTGGTITSTGTIAVDHGTSVNQIPRLVAGGKLPTSVETDPTVETFAKTTLADCSATGKKLVSSGGSFVCVDDETGLAYTAGAGLQLTVAGEFSANAEADCTDKQALIFTLVGGFVCQDIDIDATGLQGSAISNAAPQDNEVLTWDNTTSLWVPKSIPAAATTLDDLTDAATTSSNIFLGHANTMGTSNTAVGITALDSLTGGIYNTAIGDGALTATEGGIDNVALGYNAGSGNVSGVGNVFIGNSAGSSVTSGIGNIFIGHNAGANEAGSNKLYIDNSNTATPLVYGDFGSNILTINGQLKINDASIGAGKVLTSDAAGLATWVLPTSGTVASVSANAPLSVTSATTNPDITISQADTSTNGYLSSTDWNTFNSKQAALPTGGTTAQYLRGNLTFSTFLNDVLASVLTGYSSGADTALLATDSILLAFGKVQGQISGNNTDISSNSSSISTNATNISSNDTDIAANAAAIASNDTDIAANTSAISSNDTDIAANSSAIAAIDESKWTTAGSDIYRTSGKVGIGISSPETTLHLKQNAGASASNLITVDGVGNAGVGRGVGILLKVPAGSSTSVDGARIVASQGAGTSTNLSFELGTSGTLAEKMLITHTGNVGIGTNSPGSKLHLSENNSTTYTPVGTTLLPEGTAMTIYNDNGGTNTGSFLKLNTRGSANQNAYIGAVSQASGRTPNIVIGQRTGNSTYAERVRVDVNGNVGIGTSNPTNKLDVDGEARVTGKITANGLDMSGGSIYYWGSNNYVPIFMENTTGYAHMSMNGFEIGGNTNSSDEGYIKTGDNSRAIYLDPQGIKFKSAGNGTESMRISSDGNVGIGTTSPDSLLTISSSSSPTLQIDPGTDVNADPTIYLKDTGTSNGFKMWYDNTGGSTYFDNKGVADTYAIRFRSKTDSTTSTNMTILGNGNIGIGSISPKVKLDIIGENLATSKTVNGTTTALLSLHDIDAELGAGPKISFSTGYSTDQSASPSVTGATIGSYKEVGIGSGSTQYNHSLIFETSSYPAGVEEKMRLRYNGNLGIGTAAPGEKLEVNGNVKAAAYLYTSDRRFKKNINTVNDPLEKILALRGVLFDWRSDEFDQFNLPEGKEYGFIAQEVEEIAPELVITGEDGYKSVKYGNITSLLVEAFKTLEKKITSNFENNNQEAKDLSRKVASLEAENQDLKQEVINNRLEIEKMQKDLKKILEKK